MRNPATALGQILRFRGGRYLGYLLFGVLLQRPAVRLLAILRSPRRRRALALMGIILFSSLAYLFGVLGKGGTALFGGALLLAAVTIRRVSLAVKLRQAEDEARRLTERTGSRVGSARFTDWIRFPVDAVTRNAVEQERGRHPGKEIVLGRIDQDGRLLGLFGPLPDLDPVAPGEFLKRTRFDLDVVLLGEHVLVRKDYRGDRQRFVREWHALAKLQGKARVPALLRADKDTCRLYMNFIPGPTVRDVLASAGARIRDRVTSADPELRSLGRRSRARAITARGAAAVRTCFSEDFLAQCREQLDAVHRSGIAGLGVKTGNFIVGPEGRPWLVDFEASRVFDSARSLRFRIHRDVDRERFNQAFGTSLLTERSVRTELRRIEQRYDRLYAPVDFGGGVTLGSFWSVKSGTGRWEFLNGQILTPIVRGRRVLDLGSNNALMALLMLEADASEVVGVEISERNIELAGVVRRIFEWRDMRSYALRMVQGRMERFIQTTTEKFDVVTALCSLYYLERDQMREVVRCAARLAATMVVQANLAKRWETAATPFLQRLLRENGFPVVEVHAPDGYSRPVLIGRRPVGSTSDLRACARSGVHGTWPPAARAPHR